MATLSTQFLGKKFKNPFVLASGFMGVTGLSMASAAKHGFGAVTIKSLSLQPRKGHPAPVIVEFDRGLINAVGLSNPGVKEGADELALAKKEAGVPVFASVFADTVEHFAEAAKAVSKAKPDFLEIDVSCPNVDNEFGTPFACDPKAAYDVTRAVKKAVPIPLSVKLSPNVPHLGPIARQVEKAGADAINAINTLKGMVIQPEARRPVLTNKFGGISGPALFPVATRCIYEAYQSAKIPIIGTGGVTTGRDAASHLMAGASLVGIGSALHFRGLDAAKTIGKELLEFMELEGYKKVQDMVGLAHEA
ncbi:dihydroorotate dehydrogenase [Candidatus Micrarchaeota archaeon]|nr:dihydroorotate dehydrogenase [Candidatus Micrarchaeota archaeon]